MKIRTAHFFCIVWCFLYETKVFALAEQVLLRKGNNGGENSGNQQRVMLPSNPSFISRNLQQQFVRNSTTSDVGNDLLGLQLIRLPRNSSDGGLLNRLLSMPTELISSIFPAGVLGTGLSTPLGGLQAVANMLPGRIS